MELRSELRSLEQKETFLDLQKFWIEESIRNTTEDCSKYPLPNNAESRSWSIFGVFCFVGWGSRFSDPFMIMNSFPSSLNSSLL